MQKIVSFFLCLVFLFTFMACDAGAVKNSRVAPAEKEASGNGFAAHEPYGAGIGAMPGRVVWAHNPNSVKWDGSGYWWELEHFDLSVIQDMVDDSIASLGGKENAKDGWAELFVAQNKRRGKGGGYVSGQKIAIKANINGSAVFDDDTSGQTQMSYTNPILLQALLVSLVEQAGVSPSDITVYDVSRLFPDYMVRLCTSGVLQGVRFVDRSNGVADETAPIQWSRAFSGAVSCLPTCVTQAEYIINLANLKGHSYGITLCGKNHFGSFLNGNAMRPPEGANLHQWLTRNEMGIYSPLVDLMANADLGGKTVLYLLDAILCAPSEGADITASNSTWQQSPFHGNYTSSVLVSQDPVAIDSVGADLLMNEPTVIGYNSAAADKTNENYLHEAALVSNPPSHTSYTDGQGSAVTNLGVHEHWNNPSGKQYSRNLGKEEGFELIYLNPLRPSGPNSVFLGDVDASGAIDSADALEVLQYSVGLRGRFSATSDITYGDVDASGEIDAADALEILQYSVGLRQYFTAEYPSEPPQPEDNILIAYFSRTGNTQTLAGMIHNQVGGRLFEIRPLHPYPEDYQEVLEQAQGERQSNARPELASKVENMEEYDVIFLGYPIWWGDTPMAILSFLENYDLTGKIIIPFCTYGSSGFGGSLNSIRSAAPQSDILDGFGIAGSQVSGADRALSDWLEGLQLPAILPSP